MIERYEGNGRYHNVLCWNDMLFLSGQTATEAGNTIEEQARGVLKKIDSLLNQYGSDSEHILHADIFLKKREDVSAFNEIWDTWVNKGHEPTRALVISELGREPILVEIVVTAAIVD